MTQVEVDKTRLAEFCRRWQITELAEFGSSLRNDFGPASDVDLLVTFAPVYAGTWTGRLSDLGAGRDT